MQSRANLAIDYEGNSELEINSTIQKDFESKFKFKKLLKRPQTIKFESNSTEAEWSIGIY